MINLSDKVAFVANAETAVGKACVAALTQAGAQVCAAGICDAALVVNVTPGDQDSWDNAFRDCIDQLGGLDVLVIPTVAHPSEFINSIVYADFKKAHRAMVIPAFLAQNRGVLAMRSTGSTGAIVHILPAVARAAKEGAVAACTASAGILFSAKSAALECAKAKDGIVINSVLVGDVDGQPPLHYRPDSQVIPPEAIADAVLFFSTDGAVYMSGMDLAVDDGFLAT
ncbi:MAG: SDR family oxidoreductase [Rhodospirillaceae bacterium]|jgi:NAD(P)-dependent dehydrogenase (short-subunit alcohol dehydrogenase family)